MVALYYDTKRYNEALILGSQLLKELKKLDDKQLLVEVQLLESKTYFALGNVQKARWDFVESKKNEMIGDWI